MKMWRIGNIMTGITNDIYVEYVNNDPSWASENLNDIIVQHAGDSSLNCKIEAGKYGGWCTINKIQDKTTLIEYLRHAIRAINKVRIGGKNLNLNDGIIIATSVLFVYKDGKTEEYDI